MKFTKLSELKIMKISIYKQTKTPRCDSQPHAACDKSQELTRKINKVTKSAMKLTN